MHEYTATIESPEGAAHNADALEPFAESLTSDERAHDPAVSIDISRGVLSATFQVGADNIDEAAFTACLAYWGAIGAAGASLKGHSSVEIERVDDPTDSVSLDAIAKLEPHAA